jgi:hypothetical protein
MANELFMLYRIQVAVLTVLGLFAVADNADVTQPPFSHGLVQSSCAPWDGPAIDIRLTREPAQCKQVSGPYINIGVWRGLPIHSGQTVKFGPGSDAGFASRCAKEGDCERAESGTIVFDKYEQGSGASGRYELHFKGGKDLSGSLSVKWCEERVVCR